MGITREMSKILSTSTAITTDAEISAYNYLSQSTASATYLNQTAYQPGLVLIRPTSAVNGTVGTNGTVTYNNTSTVSLNGVFSSAYTRYKILIDATLSVNDGWYMRLRSNGTDSSAGIYGGQVLRADSTSAAAVRYTANNVWDIDYTRNAGNMLYEVELFNPFAASQTYGFSRYTAKLLADTMQMYFVEQGITHTANTSYDGFSMLTGTATTGTGSISVYGYRN
jgi:hypothetical protein